jgi:hypothetical protein
MTARDAGVCTTAANDPLRLKLVTEAACDINSLAAALDEFVQSMSREEITARSLAMELVIDRIQSLSSGILTALDDAETDTATIVQRIYPHNSLSRGLA